MERLTYRLEDQYGNPTDSIILESDLIFLNSSEKWKKVLSRLAAYEDTGLEPEEVRSQKELFDYLVFDSTPSEDVERFKRLRELAEADREGRCVVLPIKIPGWGWYCNDKFPNAISAYFDYPSQVVDCMEDYILRGTKEEAEAALAKGST